MQVQLSRGRRMQCADSSSVWVLVGQCHGVCWHLPQHWFCILLTILLLQTFRSCFSPRFGGRCFGIPDGCEECFDVCRVKSPGEYTLPTVANVIGTSGASSGKLHLRWKDKIQNHGYRCQILLSSLKNSHSFRATRITYFCMLLGKSGSLLSVWTVEPIQESNE